MQTKRSARQLEAIFGPLEIRVLEALWSRGASACVRDIQPAFPGVAYTTLMTTLDRLFRKGILKREKLGRAFFYSPKGSQEQLLSQLAGSTFATLLPGDGLLANFVGIPGASYRIERSADLVTWVTLETIVAPSTGLLSITDNDLLPHAYHRRIQIP